MLARLQVRLAELTSVPSRALPRAAARIQAKLREDSTTRRGNVPAYGEMGGPSTAIARGDNEVVVTAAGWVQKKAGELGQVGEWKAILKEEVERALSEGS